MILVLDYDETYTEDPIFWDSVIKSAKTRGHTVVCCTNRFNRERLDDNRDVLEDMEEHGVNVVFSAYYRDKFDAMIDHGYNPENAIWIDDSPQRIYSPFKNM